MTVSGSPVKPEVQVKTGEETAKATFGKTGELFIILANLDEAAGGTVRLSGLIAGSDPLKLEGQATLPDGEVVAWSVRRTRNAEEKKKEEELPEPPGPVIIPSQRMVLNSFRKQKKY